MSRFFSDFGPKATGQKVCIATTCYDSPDAGYVFSIQSSREALHKAGIQTAYLLLQGNCHVDDARNRIVQEFLHSDCTDLVFIDADVSWSASDLVKLCQFDRSVVGGVYPYRKEGKQDEIPARMLDGAEMDSEGLIEMEGLPTGFLRIRRHVLETLAHQSQSFMSDGRPFWLVFERTLIDGTRWGGDLNFCNRWRALGGKVFAAAEMVFSHVGVAPVKGSMAAILRKRNRETLRHVCAKVRANTHTLKDINEALAYMGNEWGAQADVLTLAIKYAREADGPIIETGSGLSTVLMAAASKYVVFCLEHDPLYVAKIRQLCVEAGTPNVGLCAMPLKDGWYDLDSFNGLPESFAFGLNDGPPRLLGDRMKFFDRIDCPLVVCDDANSYRDRLASLDAAVEHVTERAAIVRRKQCAPSSTWSTPSTDECPSIPSGSNKKTSKTAGRSKPSKQPKQKQSQLMN